ncbi:MAG: SDR family oxidoreductase [Ignavibacteria bacterium]|nr:SDR family oxidoreductase [Ignavibacteria bacterium]
MSELKRVLITGGAGFIGSHLCDKLINEGYHVIAMDNLITGTLKNIEHLFPLKEFEFYFHDVTKFVHIPGKLDYILHFASPASPSDYLKMPIHTLKVGSIGTYNLLGLAKEKKSVFLIASTSEIYGDPLVNPQNEDYWGNVNPIGPRGVYDEAKRFMEAITMAYHNYHNLDIRIARIFNTFGPRMRIDDGRALPNFMVQALKNEEVTVYGDGKQYRSFCYIDDMVEGIYKLMLSDYIYPINLGYPEMITLNHFAEEIIKLCNSKSKIVYKPLPVEDPKVRMPDITKAREILKWEPKITREEGLKRTLEYFKKILKSD